jgi:hypothetical protein
VGKAAIFSRAKSRILTAARDQFVREPPSAKSFSAIARACGLTVAELRSRYGQPAALYRRTVLAGFIEAALALRGFPPLDPRRPRRAAEAYADHLAAIFRSRAYLDLAYLLIRDRAAFAWLAGEHRQCVLRPAAFNFARTLDPAFHLGDLPPSLDQVEAAVERLQREIVLPRLAFPRGDANEPNDARAAREAVAALLAATAASSKSLEAISA